MAVTFPSIPAAPIAEGGKAGKKRRRVRRGRGKQCERARLPRFARLPGRWALEYCSGLGPFVFRIHDALFAESTSTSVHPEPEARPADD